MEIRRSFGLGRAANAAGARVASLGRGGAWAESLAAVVVLAFAAWLVSAHVATAAGGTVRARVASMSISLDTSSVSPGSNSPTTISEGPVVAETTAGQFATGTMTLTAPAGFKFVDVGTASVEPISSAGYTTLRLVSGASNAYSAAPAKSGSDTVLTVTVGAQSSENTVATDPGKVTFNGFSVVPTTTTTATGNITVGGTAVSGISGVFGANAGTLASVVGAAYAATFTAQPAATSVKPGGALTTQPIVKIADKFGNARSGDAVALSLVGGATGASLSCTTNPVTVSVAATGAAFAGCAVSKSGSNYQLQATSGVSITSDAFSVTAVAPSAAAVKSGASNTANFISNASQGAVAVDVTFPSGGPAETGTVTVTLTDSSTPSIFASGTANVASGSTTATTVSVTGINASNLTAGAVTVSASFASDAAGGATSSTTTGTAAIKDVTAPTAGTLTLDAGSDSGTSTSDKVTKVTTPTFTVAGASDGVAIASVQLRVSSDGTNYTNSGTAATTATAGSYAVTAGTLTAGTYSAVARVTDTAGNTTDTAVLSNIVIDTTAPVAPTSLDLAAADDSATDTDNVTTATSGLTISGTAEANSTVTLLLGGDAFSPAVTTTATGGGTFSVDVPLAAGSSHAITATATDAAGNVGVASSALTITVDTAAPTVALTYSTALPVKQGATVTFTATFSEAMTSAPTVAVSASNTLGATAMSQGASTSVWTYVHTVGTGDGTATVAIVGTDVAGTANATATANTFEVDNTAPTAATSLTFAATGGTVVANTLNAGNTGFSVVAAVTGDVGTAGGTAELLLGGQPFSTPITATVASGAMTVTLASGTFTTAVAAQAAVAAGSPALTVKVTDSAGNSATSSGAGNTVTVLADYTAPTVTAVARNSGTTAGTKKIGDTVWIDLTTFEAVTLVPGNGALALTVETGTTDQAAACATVSAATTITCTYTVASGDETNALTYADAATPLALSGTATLRDAAGNNATLTLPSITATGVVVDGVRPRLSAITRASSAAQFTNGGSPPAFTVTFTEAVTGVTTSNFNVLKGAGITGTPTVASVAAVTSSGGSVAWTVTLGLSGVIGTGGSTATIELVLADSTGIADVPTNALQNVVPTGASGETYILDNVAATVTGVTTTASGSKNLGDTVGITVTFSEAITSTGVATLTFNTTPSASATCPAVTALATLSCTYTVGASDTAARLDYASTTALSGTIMDAVGTPATLTLPALTTSGLYAANLVIDTTAPVAPTITLASADTGTASDGITNDVPVILNITAEAGSAVSVSATLAGANFALDVAALTGSNTADAFVPRGTGNAALADGTYIFTVTATDVAGNPSSASTLTVTIDTVAPAAPSALAVAAAYDTGASASDGITSNSSLTITGTASATMSVQLADFGTPVGTAATATGADSFSVDLTGMTTGWHAITAVATDGAGNVSPIATTYLVMVDSTGPAVAVATPDAGEYLNDPTPAFSAIALDLNGVTSVAFEYKAVATASFTAAGTVLLASATFSTYLLDPANAIGPDGAYEVRAIATDGAGNVTTTATSTFTLDTTAPTVNVVSPTVNMSARSSRPTISATATDGNGVLVVGFGLKGPGSTSFANAVGTVSLTGTTYTLTLTNALADGAYQIVAMARDLAGNITQTAPVSFLIDTAPPPSPPAEEVAAVVVKPVVVAAPVAPVVVAVPATLLAAGPANAAVAEAFSALNATQAAAIGSGLATVSAQNAAGFGAALGNAGGAATTALLQTLAILKPQEVAAVANLTAAIPVAQAGALVQTLASSSPATVASVANFAITLNVAETAQVFGSIAQLSQSGVAVSFAPPGKTEVSATGKETVTISLDDEPVAGASRFGEVEVAGVRLATAARRSVVVLVKPGQQARIARGKSGIWPDLAFPIASGALAGVTPLVSLPADALAVTFEPVPSGLSVVEQGSLGGGNVIPLGRPFVLRVEASSPTASVQFALPSLKVGLGQVVGYLYSTRTRSGSFAGYLRAPAAFDPPTSRQTWSLPASDLADLLVLPVAIQPAYVQNFEGSAHIYSGPDEFAVDFGEAGPAFTTFTVVGPQVGTRIYVYSPVSGGYGWIDALGVGPSGPPAR